MSPPGSVYFAALFNKFANTCTRREASPRTFYRLGPKVALEPMTFLCDQWPALFQRLPQHITQIHGRLSI